jgi:hypothetical protein
MPRLNGWPFSAQRCGRTLSRRDAAFYRLSNWDERTDWVFTLAVPLGSPQEGEDLRDPLGRLLEGRPVPVGVEQQEVPIGNAIEDRDAELERHHQS